MTKSKKTTKRTSNQGLELLHPAVTIALFIASPVHEIGDAIAKVLDKYVESIPKDVLKWVVPNATSEEWKPVSAQTLSRLRASLEPPGARSRKLTAFRLSDSDTGLAQYSFRLLGDPRDSDWPEATTLVQATLPIDFIEANKAEECAALVRAFVEETQPASGYCAPGFRYAELNSEEAFDAMHAVCKRFPGYDVEVNDMTHVYMKKHVRGARWVSVLGKDLTKTLGGITALRRKLADPIDVEQVGSCILVRAGDVPELGDVNRKVDTPLLRKVAKVLEPVTLFEEVDMLSNFANFDEDVLQRWERRFLDV